MPAEYQVDFGDGSKPPVNLESLYSEESKLSTPDMPKQRKVILAL